MAFNATRGGHAPGHLREMFCTLVEGEVLDRSDYWSVPERAFADPLTSITGQLWNCDDIMPSGLCDELDLPLGSTYARGAREVRSR